jgi:hypothetical protein
MALDTGGWILCLDRPFVEQHARRGVWYPISRMFVVARNIGLLCEFTLPLRISKVRQIHGQRPELQ